MSVIFTREVSIEDSIVFESVYPENLQWDLEDKQWLKDNGVEFLYMKDGESGKLIGETYYIPLDGMKNWDSDEDQPEDGLNDYYDTNCMYAFSTTILLEFQNKGYGKILKAYYLGICEAKGFDYSMGHARFNGSIQFNQYFGAKVIETFSDWYKTGEEYSLYLQKI